MNYMILSMIVGIALWTILLTLIVFKLKKRIEILGKMLVHGIRKSYIKALEARKPRRKRYIVFEVISNETITASELNHTLGEEAEKLLGILGLSDITLKLIDFDEKLKRGIIRTDNYSKYIVLALLGLIRNIGNKKVLLIPLKTTGTIKKARQLIRST